MWQVLKVQRELLMIFVGTARKRQGTSARIAQNTKSNKVDLDLERNVSCVERMNTVMLTVNKFPDEDGTRI